MSRYPWAQASPQARRGALVSGPASGYDGVAILAPVTVPYRRYSDHGAAWFIGRALGEMVHGLEIAKDAFDGLAVSSFSLAPDSAVTITEYLGLSPRWLEHLPMGGASGVIALRRAARAVQAGDADMVACIGADGLSPGGFHDLVANFSVFSREAVFPYGAGGPNAVFALMTRSYMDRFGATREDFGRICLAQRANAAHNPHALLRDPMTMEDYLGARPIAEPLHLFDCVMPCAGAEGFVVTTTDRARDLSLPYATVLSAGERHNAFFDDPVQLRGGWSLYREELYATAGVGPPDMDFLQTYDDYPVVVMLQLEELGLCDTGKAPEFVRTTPLTCDGGGLPHNTSGGQLSVGQAGSAGGFLGVTEALRQLQGRPLGQAVPQARVGLVSGYGMVNYDRGLCTAAAILARGER